WAKRPDDGGLSRTMSHNRGRKRNWSKSMTRQEYEGEAKMKELIQSQLLETLGKIDRPGTFCTSGLLPAILPGLEVAGVGPMGLPLEKRQATALKKQARQAP